jgi:hypothetical protein
MTELPADNFVSLLISKHFQQDISYTMKVILCVKKHINVILCTQFCSARGAETGDQEDKFY